MIIPFATTSYKEAALPISAQRLVNMYAEREPPDAKTAVAVFGAPGLVQFAEAGIGPVRGFIDFNGVLYAVSGGELFSISSTGVAVDVGGAIGGTGPVSMESNGTQIIIVNGTSGYIFTIAGGLQLITDADFFAANTVTFLDQRFILDRIGTNQFFISDSLDGTSYQALAIASAESRPDFVKAVVTNGQILLVFGERTIEPWQDVGAANFPFERVPGVVIERGLLAPHAFCKADNTVFFIGENRVLYRMQGLSPQRVSNPAIEREWQTYATVSDVFLFSHFFDGHEFLYVTFPIQSATWVFDISTGLAHERESWDMSGNSYARWRGNCHINIYGRQLIGDAFSGKIGYLDNSIYTEYGNTIRGLAVAPPIHSDRKRVFMPRFELDVDSGVGLIFGQGDNPQIMLDWSDDGGYTWSQQQLWRSMGKIGAYKQRLRWLRLGQSRDRVMRISISDPVRRTIIAANADITVGM